MLQQTVKYYLPGFSGKCAEAGQKKACPPVEKGGDRQQISSATIQNSRNAKIRTEHRFYDLLLPVQLILPFKFRFL